MLEFAVADFSHTTVVALAFCLVSLELELFNLLLVALDLVEQGFLTLPLGTLLLLISFKGVDDFVQFGKFLLVTLTLDGLTFNLHLLESSTEFVNLLRHRVTFHAKFSGCLIHQVDGLVGQETVGDVTVAELDGRDDGLVLDTHLVMVLVAFLQTSQDGDGRRHIWFIHHDGLETAFECLVLLEILLIFVEGRRTDAAQFATSQSWLEDVGGIHRTARLTSTHEGVDLVDEEDDLPLTLHNRLDDCLESLLKLTLILGTCDEGTHIEGVELLVLQVFGHIATYDTSCKTFDNGGLTRTRFTDKNRIVLGSTTENLEDSPDFVVTADDRVEFSILRPLHEVRCISFEHLLASRLLVLIVLIVVVHNSTWFLVLHSDQVPLQLSFHLPFFCRFVRFFG